MFDSDFNSVCRNICYICCRRSSEPTASSELLAKLRVAFIWTFWRVIQSRLNSVTSMWQRSQWLRPKWSRLLQTRPKKSNMEISETFIIKLRSSDPKQRCLQCLPFTPYYFILTLKDKRVRHLSCTVWPLRLLCGIIITFVSCSDGFKAVMPHDRFQPLPRWVPLTLEIYSKC